MHACTHSSLTCHLDPSGNYAASLSRFYSSPSVFDDEVNGFGQGHSPSPHPKEHRAPGNGWQGGMGIQRGRETSLADLDLPQSSRAFSGHRSREVCFQGKAQGPPRETDCAWKAMEAHPTLRKCVAADPRAPRGSMPMAVVMLTGEKKMLPSFVLLSFLKRSTPNRAVAAPRESMKILARSRTTIKPERERFTYLNGFGSQEPFLLLFLFLR